MEKAITIVMKPHDSQDYVKIPVHYRLEQENDRVLNFICSVKADAKELPEWLYLREFTIRQITSDGYPSVTTTEFSSIPTKTVNEAMFVHSTHDHIRIAEKIRL